MKRILSVLMSGMLFIWWGCQPEFTPYGEYKEIPFVYGLLNPMDTVHYVKIYRLFRAEGDAKSVARIPDSIYYRDGEIEAYVEEMSSDGNPTGNKWTLVRTTLNNKDSGVFAYPEQVVYKFTAPLKFEYRYKINVSVKKAGGEPYQVWAEAKIPPKTNIVFQGSASVTKEVQFATSKEFKSTVVSFDAYPEIALYEIEVRFRYYDSLMGGGMVEKWVSYRNGMYEWNQTTQMTDPLKGEVFYSQVASQVKPIMQSSGVVRRIPDSLFVYLWVADREFIKYKKSVMAGTSSFQQQSIYTNVQNGMGIWASRYYVSITGYLDYPSRKELITGTINKETGNLGFCEPKISYDSYFCF